MRRWVVGCLLVGFALVGGTVVLVDGPATPGVDSPSADATATASPAPDRGADAAAGPAGDAESSSLGAAADFDRTLFRIVVFANGSARWQFRYVRVLGTNETARDQFEAFAREFNTEETPLYRDFVDRASALTSSAGNATGREMTARNFARDARVVRDVEDLGVVEMSFTWTAFAALEGDRVIVGDVFDGGLFLAADKSLQIVTGPGLQFSSIDPEGTLDAGSLADSTTVTWQGERNFPSGRPRVVLVPASETTGEVSAASSTSGAGETTTGPGTRAVPTTATETVTATPSGVNNASSPGGGGGGTSPMLLGLGALVVLVGAGAAVWVRSVGGVGGTGTSDPGDDGPAAGGSVAASESATTEESDTAGETQTEAAASAVPPEELMSDEDRVVSMLEERGGRMRQVQIVEETDWSKSKVSMLLSDMEEEGTISKLRVGRENIISLDGEEPEAAGSPFENED